MEFQKFSLNGDGVCVWVCVWMDGGSCGGSGGGGGGGGGGVVVVDKNYGM